MTEAARLLLGDGKEETISHQSTDDTTTSDPVLGTMRDAADELDEIVADAMRRRREAAWRTIPGE